jgi:hypothetical protein
MNGDTATLSKLKPYPMGRSESEYAAELQAT